MRWKFASSWSFPFSHNLSQPNKLVYISKEHANRMVYIANVMIAFYNYLYGQKIQYGLYQNHKYIILCTHYSNIYF